MNAYISLKDTRFNYPYKGFCSIVCAIIDIALEHYEVYDNTNCLVDEHQTLKLFDNIYDDVNIEYDAGSWWLDRFFGSELHHSKYSAHTIADVNDLKLKNKILNSILNIKLNKIEEYEYKLKNLKITDSTLGVQIRGTDKKTEIPEPNIHNIVKKIDYYFEENGIKNIFLATDDIKYLNFFREKYGDLLLYDDSVMISEDQKPLHLLSNRDKINEEVLSNVYILSKCKHFLYSFSNVSYLSLILGANNFKTIMNLNQ
jgi:hypothetical protein